MDLSTPTTENPNIVGTDEKIPMVATVTGEHQLCKIAHVRTLIQNASSATIGSVLEEITGEYHGYSDVSGVDTTINTMSPSDVGNHINCNNNEINDSSFSVASSCATSPMSNISPNAHQGVRDHEVGIPSFDAIASRDGEGGNSSLDERMSANSSSTSSCPLLFRYAISQCTNAVIRGGQMISVNLPLLADALKPPHNVVPAPCGHVVVVTAKSSISRATTPTPASLPTTSMVTTTIGGDAEVLLDETIAMGASVTSSLVNTNVSDQQISIAVNPQPTHLPGTTHRGISQHRLLDGQINLLCALITYACTKEGYTMLLCDMFADTLLTIAGMFDLSLSTHSDGKKEGPRAVCVDGNCPVAPLNARDCNGEFSGTKPVGMTEDFLTHFLHCELKLPTRETSLTLMALMCSADANVRSLAKRVMAKKKLLLTEKKLIDGESLGGSTKLYDATGAFEGSDKGRGDEHLITFAVGPLQDTAVSFSLALLIMERGGASAIATEAACEELFQRVPSGVSMITSAQIAECLSLFSNFKFAEADGIVPLFVSAVSKNALSLNWRDVILALDHPSILVGDFRVIALAYRTATGSPLPCSVFFHRWINTKVQAKALFFAIQNKGQMEFPLGISSPSQATGSTRRYSLESSGGFHFLPHEMCPAHDLCLGWRCIEFCAAIAYICSREPDFDESFIKAATVAPSLLFAGFLSCQSQPPGSSTHLMAALDVLNISGGPKAALTDSVARYLERSGHVKDLAVVLNDGLKSTEPFSFVDILEVIVSTRLVHSLLSLPPPHEIILGEEGEMLTGEEPASANRGVICDLSNTSLKIIVGAAIAGMENRQSPETWIEERISRHDDGKGALQHATKAVSVAHTMENRGMRRSGGHHATIHFVAILIDVCTELLNKQKFVKATNTVLEIVSKSSFISSIMPEAVKHARTFLGEIPDVRFPMDVQTEALTLWNCVLDYHRKDSLLALYAKFFPLHGAPEGSHDKMVFECVVSFFLKIKIERSMPFDSVLAVAQLFGYLVNNNLLNPGLLFDCHKLIFKCLNRREREYNEFGMLCIESVFGHLSKWPEFGKALLKIKHVYIDNRIPGAMAVIRRITATTTVSLQEDEVLDSNNKASSSSAGQGNINGGNVLITGTYGNAVIGAPTCGGINMSLMACLKEFQHQIDNKSFECPPVAEQEMINYLTNNIEPLNFAQTTAELRQLVTPRYYFYFSTYMVTKRIAREPQRHAIYDELITSFGNKLLEGATRLATFHEIHRLLDSDRIHTDFDQKTVLRTLGNWLGQTTLERNIPILETQLSFSNILCKALKEGKLWCVVQFATKVLEHCTSFKRSIFNKPNPWTMYQLGCLVEVASLKDLKSTLFFEINLLRQTLSVTKQEVQAFMANCRSDKAKAGDQQQPTLTQIRETLDVSNNPDFELPQTRSRLTAGATPFVPPGTVTESDLVVSVEELRYYGGSTDEYREELKKFFEKQLLHNEIMKRYYIRVLNIVMTTVQDFIAKDFRRDVDQVILSQAATSMTRSLAANYWLTYKESIMHCLQTPIRMLMCNLVGVYYKLDLATGKPLPDHFFGNNGTRAVANATAGETIINNNTFNNYDAGGGSPVRGLPNNNNTVTAGDQDKSLDERISITPLGASGKTSKGAEMLSPSQFEQEVDQLTHILFRNNEEMLFKRSQAFIIQQLELRVPHILQMAYEKMAPPAPGSTVQQQLQQSQGGQSVAQSAEKSSSKYTNAFIVSIYEHFTNLSPFLELLLGRIRSFGDDYVDAMRYATGSAVTTGNKGSAAIGAAVKSSLDFPLSLYPSKDFYSVTCEGNEPLRQLQDDLTCIEESITSETAAVALPFVFRAILVTPAAQQKPTDNATRVRLELLLHVLFYCKLRLESVDDGGVLSAAHKNGPSIPHSCANSFPSTGMSSLPNLSASFLFLDETRRWNYPNLIVEMLRRQLLNVADLDSALSADVIEEKIAKPHVLALMEHIIHREKVASVAALTLTFDALQYYVPPLMSDDVTTIRVPVMCSRVKEKSIRDHIANALNKWVLINSLRRDEEVSTIAAKGGCEAAAAVLGTTDGLQMKGSDFIGSKRYFNVAVNVSKNANTISIQSQSLEDSNSDSEFDVRITSYLEWLSTTELLKGGADSPNFDCFVGTILELGVEEFCTVAHNLEHHGNKLNRQSGFVAASSKPGFPPAKRFPFTPTLFTRIDSLTDFLDVILSRRLKTLKNESAMANYRATFFNKILSIALSTLIHNHDLIANRYAGAEGTVSTDNNNEGSLSVNVSITVPSATGNLPSGSAFPKALPHEAYQQEFRQQPFVRFFSNLLLMAFPDSVRPGVAGAGVQKNALFSTGYPNTNSGIPGKYIFGLHQSVMAATDMATDAEYIQAFLFMLHKLTPMRFPAFTFGWLELLSHRRLFGRLFGPPAIQGVCQERHWASYAGLLVEACKFIQIFTEPGGPSLAHLIHSLGPLIPPAGGAILVNAGRCSSLHITTDSTSRDLVSLTPSSASCCSTSVIPPSPMKQRRVQQRVFPPPVLVFVRSLVKLFLFILHDRIEFLYKAYYFLVDHIPLCCVQLRNIVMSAFPLNFYPPEPLEFRHYMNTERSKEMLMFPREAEDQGVLYCAMQGTDVRETVYALCAAACGSASGGLSELDKNASYPQGGTLSRSSSLANLNDIYNNNNASNSFTYSQLIERLCMPVASSTPLPFSAAGDSDSPSVSPLPLRSPASLSGSPIRLRSNKGTLIFSSFPATTAAPTSNISSLPIAAGGLSKKTWNIPLVNSIVMLIFSRSLELTRRTLTEDISQFPATRVFVKLAVAMNSEERYYLFTAMVNQLRYPNLLTHYFMQFILFMFNTQKSVEAALYNVSMLSTGAFSTFSIGNKLVGSGEVAVAALQVEKCQEQLLRALVERLMCPKPFPWGVLVTFYELCQSSDVVFWEKPFVKAVPELERILLILAKRGAPSVQR